MAPLNFRPLWKTLSYMYDHLLVFRKLVVDIKQNSNTFQHNISINIFDIARSLLLKL